MNVKQFRCPHCNRQNFKSQRGLTQHQMFFKVCELKAQTQIEKADGCATAHEHLSVFTVGVSQKKFTETSKEFVARTVAENMLVRQKLMCNGKNLQMSTTNQLVDEHDTQVFGSNADQDSQNLELKDSENEISTNNVDDQDDAEMGVIDVDSDTTSPEKSALPSSHLLDKFKECVFVKAEKYEKFTSTEEKAIKLLMKLRRTIASLNTCDSAMKWHLFISELITNHQSISDFSQYLSQKRVFERSRNEHCVTPDDGHTAQQITLSHSKAIAKIVCCDAKSAIISLLTDPRIFDSDCLFHGDNSLQPPPQNLNFVKDSNTERAYIHTHRELMTKPQSQILLPVIFYMNAATTGQFFDSPVTAVEFTLEIFNEKARDKNCL